MNLLLTIRQPHVAPESPAMDPTGFRERVAARAVLLDARGRVHLLKVGRHHYHKLPGGGVDPGETIEAAMRRELLEEVGCRAEIVAELGMIVEYRDFARLKQISYCYLARQVGRQQPAALEEAEIEEGLSGVRAPSLTAALAWLERDVPDNLEGRFIQRRDSRFLQAALHLSSAAPNG